MTIAVASGNAHKIKEIGGMLSLADVEFVSMRSLGVTEDIEENGMTFAENALIKARFVCRKTGLPAIADDSGLCVDALDGAPGVFSARFAADETPGASDEANVDKLLRLLEGVPDEKRTAHFVCAMAAVFPDGEEAVVTGRCFGRITHERHGTGGFGYDPVFFADDVGKTFGDASEEEKNAVSHRANAVSLLKKELIAKINVKGA